MWEGLFTLLSFCGVMGVASFLAGSLPLSFGLTGKSTRIISALGTGLLIGTCLIIIIPEGIETLYSAHAQSTIQPDPSHYNGPSEGENEDEDVLLGRREAEGDHDHHEPHGWVGLSLVVGFIMMYLIDEIPRHAAKLSWRQRPVHVSLADMSSGLRRPSSDAGVDEEEANLPNRSEPARANATTLGLVIHAAADGIALAASSFITEASTGMIVFLALMIHKAPAAFGLTSVLLKQGLTKRQARGHLIVFSLAAPIGAVITWVLVNLVAGGQIEGEEGARFATGLILLFSGGTFLYVAMHQMQEGIGGHDAHNPLASEYLNAHAFSGRSSKDEGKAMDLRDTLLAALGMLLPLLAQLGHAH